MRPRLLALAPLAVLACSHASPPYADAPPFVPDAPSADAPDPLDGGATDAPAPLRLLVLNEVAAGETPDWFEVINATAAPLALADFVFVDKAGDLARAVAFPAVTLAPGAYFAQDVDGTVVPFKLAADEELWIYRASDQALSDGVDWAAGDSPTGGSYARNPDSVGAFVTTTKQTKGQPNQF